jgi:predicted RNase H-like nuclease
MKGGICMGEYIKKKKDMVFQSVESLQQVVNVIKEAAIAVNDKTRTIRESAISEVLAGAIGAGIGGVGSFAALYGLGSVVGLSAAGITSGLAAAGGIVGGGMVAGVFVLAAPVALLAAGGVGLASHLRHKQLRQEKECLYKEALKKHQAIIQALKDEANADKERLDYLQSLNILLTQAIKDLRKDLGETA